MKSSPKIGLPAIFFSFAKIGAVLIGGGYVMLPLLEDEMVRRRKWATSEEVADFFALAQLLPGVIAINAAMLMGNRLRGFAGNVAAALGVVCVPFVLIAAYAIAYSQLSGLPAVAKVLEGVRPAVAGMMLALGWNMVRKSAKETWQMALAVGVAAVAAVWNPPIVLFILAAIAAGIAWNAVRARKECKS
ncbi:MAG: chromate transporter [Kiritimatiellae bacterium]|nr:chromate transporter [Kiritimatiellia bacterium]